MVYGSFKLSGEIISFDIFPKNTKSGTKMKSKKEEKMNNYFSLQEYWRVLLH